MLTRHSTMLNSCLFPGRKQVCIAEPSVRHIHTTRISHRSALTWKTNRRFATRCLSRAEAEDHQHSSITDESQPSEYHDLDEDDDAFYERIAKELPIDLADDIDPEGRELTLEDLVTAREGTPQSLRHELHAGDVWGPPAVVLAGFRAEELAMVRAILDAAGGQDVKVIPCNEAMLHEPMSRAVSLPEPDWEQRRPEGWTRGGDWGSQRTILFSGMKLAAQAALVELVEEQGLPPVCAALAVEEDADVPLGRVLAQAVQAQRTRRNPRKNIWEELDQERLVRDTPNIEAILQQRAEEIQRQLDAGDLENIYVRDDASGSGGDIPLAELQARQEQDEQYEDGPEAEPEDWPDVSQDESYKADEALPHLGADDGASNSPAAEDAGAAEQDVAPAAAAEDAYGTGHPGSPASECSEKDSQDSRSAEGAEDEEDSMMTLSAATAAQDSESSAASTPGREGSFQMEGQQDSAAMARQAEKLAKQRELFGASFSTPKRPILVPKDRAELSASALQDPLTPRENSAVRAQVGTGQPESGRPSPERVREDTAAAGKAFMDSLAQNVGLADDFSWSEPPPITGPGSPAPINAGTIDLIDAIAEGRADVPLSDSPAKLPLPSSANELPKHQPEDSASASSDQPSVQQSAGPQQSAEQGKQKPKVELHMSTAGRDKATERIMKDLDSSFAKMRDEADKDKVTASVRKEALGPTRDAIKAALACGLTAADLKQLIDEEARHRDIHGGQLGRPWHKVPTMTPGASELSDRERHDILSPLPIPRGSPVRDEL